MTPQDTLGRGCAWQPVRMSITAGTVAACTQACKLVESIDACHLLADKGYDSDTFADILKGRQIIPVIPPRKRRKAPRDYDKYLYGFRHLVENAFLELNAGVGLPLAMPKIQHHFWLPYTSGVSPFGQTFIDDTV